MATTWRPVLILLVLLLAGLPAHPARAAGAPPVENLANGSFEGLAGQANGYTTDGSGAGIGAIARTGAQSVDLGRPATPDAARVLGRVRAFPMSAVPLSQVTAISFYSDYPLAASGRSVSLRLVLVVSTTGAGAADECFAATFPVSAGASFEIHDGGLGASYQKGGAACAPGGASQTLGALQADPAFAQATILEAWIQSVTDTGDAWPAGASLYVDDASLMATHSDRVRIQDASHNLCSGASFADVPSALACAASGATLLLAPVAFTGPFTLAQPVTLCGVASASDTSCAPGSNGATLQGDGASPVVVTITSPDVTLRNLVVQNPSYAGSAEAILVDVRADRAHIEGSLLVQPAADPAPGVARSQTGVLVENGAQDAIVRGNSVFAFPAPVGRGATCAACRSVGVRLAGGSGYSVVANSFDLGTGAPAIGVRVVSGSGAISADSFSMGSSSTGVLADAGTSPTLDHLSLTTVGSNTPTNVVGLDVRTTSATLVGNGIVGYSTAIRLDPAGAPLRGNTLWQNVVDVAIASGSGAQTIAEHRSLGSTTLLQVASPAHDLAIDARGADWGAYTRAAILAKIQDAGVNDAVDVTCYLDSDHATRVCPPRPSFTIDPAAPVWNRNVAFSDTSSSGGRGLASRSWDFGDGTTLAGAEVVHAFAQPGTYDVTLTVSDSEGASNATTVQLVVSDAAPVFDAMPDALIGENETLSFRARATDADGDAITYAPVALPEGASLDAATGAVSWQPSFAQEGAYDLVVEASDGARATSATRHVVVEHRNAPPQVSLTGSLRGAEGQTIRVDVGTRDEDGDTVRTSASPLILGMTYADHGDGTGTFSWTPSPSDAGSYPVTFEASDGVNVTHLPVSVTVSDTDRPPYLTSPASLVTLREGARSVINLVCADPDGDACTIAAVSVPFGAKFDATRVILDWTPTYDQAGWYNATMRVSDGTLSVDVRVPMRVLNTDRAPKIFPVANQTTLTNRTITVRLTAQDPDGDAVTFSSPDAPAGLTFSGANMVYRPPLGAEGLQRFHVQASDGTLSSATTVNVSVGANHAPVVILDGPTRVDALQRFVLSGYGSGDPDGSALRYSWDFNESDGAQMDATGMNVTTSFPSPSDRNVTLTVTDADGLTTTAKITVVVDDALFLNMLVLPSSARGEPITVQVWVRDWRAVGVPGVSVSVEKAFQPVGALDPLLAVNATGVTGSTGLAYFRLPPDTQLGDLPGAHVVVATASLPGSYLGDVETASVRSTYGASLV